MFAFIFSTVLLFAAEAGHGGGTTAAGGFSQIWNTYFNYPGFEAWKFLNLAVFIAVLVYLLRKPLSEAFKARREAIRAELIRAEEERKAALAKLTETESKLAQLDATKAHILETAEKEAVLEKARIAQATEEDIRRLREQARSEIERSSQQARKELRKFSAEESIHLAEEKIRREINAEKDARLVRESVQSIGGLA